MAESLDKRCRCRSICQPSTKATEGKHSSLLADSSFSLTLLFCLMCSGNSLYHYYIYPCIITIYVYIYIHVHLCCFWCARYHLMSLSSGSVSACATAQDPQKEPARRLGVSIGLTLPTKVEEACRLSQRYPRLRVLRSLNLSWYPLNWSYLAKPHLSFI